MKVTKRYLNLIAGAVALVWATGSMALTLGPDDADTMSNENSALNATDVANVNLADIVRPRLLRRLRPRERHREQAKSEGKLVTQ